MLHRNQHSRWLLAKKRPPGLAAQGQTQRRCLFLRSTQAPQNQETCLRMLALSHRVGKLIHALAIVFAGIEGPRASSCCRRKQQPAGPLAPAQCRDQVSGHEQTRHSKLAVYVRRIRQTKIRRYSPELGQTVQSTAQQSLAEDEKNQLLSLHRASAKRLDPGAHNRR